MKAFNKIVVFENDDHELSYLATKAIQAVNKNNAEVEPWFNFHISFTWDKEKAFGRLKQISSEDKTIVITNPSFAGPDNAFTNYLLLFLKLKEMNIKLDVGIIFYDGFITFLLEFLNDETNGAKKANNHRILKEVLDFHNIYEIEDDSFNVIHLTYDYLMQFYLERHHALGIDKCRIKATGEIYDVYAVYYHKDYKKAEITLRIESDCNNKYSFGELEKISK